MTSEVDAAEIKRLREIVGLLQEDLAKMVEDGDRCEGCGAPIAFDEDACTVSEVNGCWGYASDAKGTPCWRYRTKEGMDRAWPECAPLAAPSPAPVDLMERVEKALEVFRSRIEANGEWDDGCFYYRRTSASELEEPLRLAREVLSDLRKARGKG